MKIIVSEEIYNRINERNQDVDFIEIAHKSFNEIHGRLKELTQDGNKSFEEIESDVNSNRDFYLRKGSFVIFYKLPKGTLKDDTIIIRIINKKVSTLGSAFTDLNTINLYGHREGFNEFIRNIDKIFDAGESTFVHELGHLIDFNKSAKIFRRYKRPIKPPAETDYKSEGIYKKAIERYQKLQSVLGKRFKQYKQQNAETSVIYYESLYPWYKYAMEDHEERLNDWNDEKDFYLKEYSENLGYEVSEEEGFEYYLSSNSYLCEIDWISKEVYNEYVYNVGYNISKNQDSKTLTKSEKLIRSRVYTFFSKLADILGVDCSKKINWDD